MENDFKNGMLAMENKNYDDAIRYFSRCIDVNPENFEAFYQRGLAKSYIPKYVGDISIKDEIEDFTLAINLHPDYFDAYCGRGLAYSNLENYELAILDYSKAIEIQPSDASNYSHRAYLYIQSKKYSQAVIDLDYFIENEKSIEELMWAYEKRAFANLVSRNYSNAILDFNKILPNEKRSDYYLSRARAYFGLAKYKDAIIDFNAALKIDQEEQSARFFLNLIDEIRIVSNISGERTLPDFIQNCQFLLTDDDFENLYNEANECVKVYPSFYLGYIFRAFVYLERKEYYKLNLDINESIKLKPGNEFALKLYEGIPYHLQKIEILIITYEEKKQKNPSLGFFHKLFAPIISSKETITEPKSDTEIKPIIEWVDIPSGTFIMGSPLDEPERGYEPQCQVTLSAFKMSKYLITFEQFDLFCEATYRLKPIDEGWDETRGRGKRPVVYISWFDALEFAEWMGCRLPSGAEWEYACRAGTTTPFYTGENLTTSEANYNGNHPYNNNKKGENRKIALPVGSFPPNSWGLYDMHGNVWECCNDWCGEHPTTPQINPQGPSTGKYRMIRGGSFCNSAHSARSASIAGDYPYNHSENHGFRLVLIEKEIL